MSAWDNRKLAFEIHPLRHQSNVEPSRSALLRRTAIVLKLTRGFGINFPRGCVAQRKSHAW
jgi:hypothetical protein